MQLRSRLTGNRQYQFQVIFQDRLHFMGRVKRDWQDIGTVLGYFGRGHKAIEKYERYLEEGISLDYLKPWKKRGRH